MCMCVRVCIRARVLLSRRGLLTHRGALDHHAMCVVLELLRVLVAEHEATEAEAYRVPR